MNLETVQVRLALTDDPEILNTLRRKKQFSQKNGQEILIRQFDGFPFEFVKGRVVTVGSQVAEGLKHDARIIVGDDLTGQMKCALVEVGRHSLTSGRLEVSGLSCPVCGEVKETPAKLGAHLMRHSNAGAASASARGVQENETSELVPDGDSDA